MTMNGVGAAPTTLPITRTTGTTAPAEAAAPAAAAPTMAGDQLTVGNAPAAPAAEKPMTKEEEDAYCAQMQEKFDMSRLWERFWDGFKDAEKK